MRMQVSWGDDKLNTIDLVANKKGFTLIELLSVLVIMSVMLSVGIRKFDLLSDTASITALKEGVRELNTQETLIWTQIKLSETDWTSDADVFNSIDKNLGQGYRWNPGPNIGGGTLYYKSRSVVLVRNESTRNSVGSWL